MFPVSTYPDFAPGGGEPVGLPHDDLPIGYHRGHIFARALGGVNSAFNLVPMPQAINNGDWATMERALTNAHAAVAMLPVRIYFRAELAYAHPNAGDPTIPNSVSAWGYQLPILAPGAGLVAARTVALSTAIAGGIPNRIYRINPPSNFSAAGDQPFVFTGPQNTAFQNVVNAFNIWAGAPVPGGGNTGGTPVGGRGDPPAGIVPGPYAFLDVLEDGAVGPGLIAGLNAAFGAAVLPPAGLNYPAGGAVKRNNQNFAVGFTQDQKRLIRLANRWLNTGRLTSDNLWFDNQRRLLPSETEIDHIIPVGAAAGNSSNFYWNAQVTSKSYNNQKGNNLDAVFQANYMAAPAVGAGAPIKRVRRRTNRYTPY
ncbi:DNA/RNA non-specific endonuclease [Trinickia diaoshuihuensis]|jgi:5-methylcytosine-specific restriction endonuclease McrA|uniref:DNA/RNA non-specific endonuclease n=1 Tax=Trinickia diaoshuihuensis TaxID=2292265 RepID=UPI0013C33AD7|nr:DNA/RNA non-specific endonuclease [Trinickia diaoshuihuensis]